MTRVRLREAYPDPAEFYASRYPDGYQHDRWPDHVERVEATVQFAWDHLRDVFSLADLSAGDGVIAEDLLVRMDRDALVKPYLSDFRPREGYADCGPVEETVSRMPWTDLFVCSETLEHLDDPDAFLRAVRAKAGRLLVTTPLGETDPLQNPEHYWGWDSDAVRAMLTEAGWRPYAHQLFTPSCGPYTFQMWLCS